MAPQSKKKAPDAVLSKSQFAESLQAIGIRFGLSKVFDDFLTMSIAACSRNPKTGLSHYEDEYLQTIAAYKDSELRHEFPKAFASLVAEMEARADDERGNDILGEFFEQHFANDRTGQVFTPFHICTFMTKITHDASDKNHEPGDRPLRILDPACGSGRMLLAAHKEFGQGHEYYAIDIDRVCVKMTALNLFLNGIWNSEVMCANALMPDDFVCSYRISFIPFGIFKIEKKEASKLWHLQQHALSEKNPNV